MAKQAAAPNFESILDQRADEVERPRPAPAGTYDGIIKGMYEEGKSSRKGTPFVRFTYAFVAAGDDVDEEALNDWLTSKDGSADNLAERTIKDTYYTTPDALFMLTDMLEAIGIDLTDKSVRAALSETPNMAVRFAVGHRPSEDGQQVFAEIKKVLKVD